MTKAFLLGLQLAFGVSSVDMVDIIIYCEDSHVDMEYCQEEIIQCITDDVFTLEECVEELELDWRE